MRAKGSFDGPRLAYTINSNDQLLSAAEYKPIIISYQNNSPVRLQDIAEVIDGAENVRQAAWMNKEPAIILNIQRQPGANVIEVVERVKICLNKFSASLPSGIQVKILTDRTITIRASIHDVQFELLLSIVLVVHGDFSLFAQSSRNPDSKYCRSYYRSLELLLPCIC